MTDEANTPAESDANINDISRAFGIPEPLVKASIDPFDYAVGLRDGTVIRFEHCSFDKDHVFVKLRGIRSHSIAVPVFGPDVFEHNFNFERGLDVRIVDILWAADAPHGS